MKQVKEIKFYLLCLIAFALVAYIYAAPICIILYSVLWLVEGKYTVKFTAFAKNKYALLFSGFYLLHLLGMLYTKNQDNGWFNLEIKLSIFVFPLLLVSEGVFEVKKQRQLMYAFIWGCVINGIICLGYAIWKYYALGVYEFTYMQFEDLLHLHPSYYSMYIDLALLFIYQIYTSNKTGMKRGESAFLLLSVFFLVFVLTLLQSKAGWAISGLVLFVLLVKMVLQQKKMITSVIMLLGVAIICSATYKFIITSNGLRLTTAKNVITTGAPDASSPESTQVRYYTWKSSFGIIKEHPIIGAGTGDAQDYLHEQYVKNNYTGALEKNLNSHEEYLQCGVAVGIIGMLCLLACLVLPLFKAIKEKRFIYAMFLGVLMLNFLVESMLETQGGTMFYGLFNSLLMFNFVI